jgi:hypothetical protein
VTGGEWLALASVVSTATVSVVTVVLNHALQRRERLRADEKERLADLRAVLESAGAAVSEAIGAARRRVVAQDADDRRKTGEFFEDKSEAVQLFEIRIAIRCGSKVEMTWTYGSALAQLRILGKELFEAEGVLDPDGQARANELIDGVSTAQRRYLDLARAALAGTRPLRSPRAPGARRT